LHRQYKAAQGIDYSVKAKKKEKTEAIDDNPLMFGDADDDLLM
jgi:hypothetical protein